MKHITICRKKVVDLFVMTTLMSIILLGILYYQKLNDYDLYMVISLLVINTIFMYSLVKYDCTTIDLVHLLYGLYVFLSLFVENVYIITIFIIKLSIMFAYWIIDDKCPMGDCETFQRFDVYIKQNENALVFTLITSYMILFYKYFYSCAF